MGIQTWLARADLTRAQLPGASMIGVDLRGATLDEAELAAADLSGSDLREVHASRVNAPGVRLRGADLSGAHFEGANLDGADFTVAAAIGADFSGASLRSARIRGTDRTVNMDFTGADLTGASFEGRLHGLKFRGATMSGSSSSGPIELKLCDFRSADLTQVKWTIGPISPGGMGMWQVDFSDADLTDATILSITGSPFPFARAEYPTRFAPGCEKPDWSLSLAVTDAPSVSFRGARLVRTRFSGFRFLGPDFRGASALDSNFSSNRVTEAQFGGADFTGADFSISQLVGAQAAGAVFDGAIFYGSTLADGDFRGASMRGAEGERMFVFRSNFLRADLRELTLSNACLGQSTFEEARFEGAQGEYTRFRSVDVAFANFEDTQFSRFVNENTDFSTAAVPVAVHTPTAAYRLFVGRDLSEDFIPTFVEKSQSLCESEGDRQEQCMAMVRHCAQFEDPLHEQCKDMLCAGLVEQGCPPLLGDFNACDLVYTGEADLVLDTCQLYEVTNFTDATMGPSIRDAEMTRANLTRTQLLGTDLGVHHDLFLDGANMSGATVGMRPGEGRREIGSMSLRGTIVDDVRFESVEMVGAVVDPLSMERTEFIDVGFRWSYLRGEGLALLREGVAVRRSEANGGILTDERIVQSLRTNRMRDTNLNGATFTGQGLSFGDNDLQGSTAVGVRAEGALRMLQSLLSNTDWTDAELPGLQLLGSHGRGIDYTRANLSGGDLSDSLLLDVDGTGADLSGAEMRGAQLSFSAAAGIDLSGVTLPDQDLSGLDLTGARMVEAELPGVVFSDAVLTGADLSSADLTGALARTATFDTAILTRANLSRALLAGSSFVDADLVGVNLSRAELVGVDLTGANLAGANFTHALMSRARLCASALEGLSETQRESVQIVPGC